MLALKFMHAIDEYLGEGGDGEFAIEYRHDICGFWLRLKIRIIFFIWKYMEKK